MNTLYVSPSGNDAWSGHFPEPNNERTDGPLATLTGARNRIRHLSQPPAYHERTWSPQGIEGPITVQLRGGIHRLREPLTFGPDDCALVHYTAYPGETPVIDGGELLTGWEHGEVNGCACWTLDLPEVARGEWYFHSLFVNGRRCPRPRLPKSDWFWIEDVPGKGLDAAFHEGSDRFIARKGDVKPWANLTDVEVVVLHLWNDEHMPITAFDEATGLVTSSRRSIFCLRDDMQEDLPPRFAKYYVQNVFEALSEPGEWYLDRSAGRLYYLPLPGETPETAEVFAPRLTQLMTVTGDVATGRQAQNLRFTGLTFRHTDAVLPPGGWDRKACNEGEGMRSWPNQGNYASAPQAAINIPGVICFEAARGCAVEDCLVEHTGWCAVEIGEGCNAIRVVGNELRHLGAGGVKIHGADTREPRLRRTGNHVVTDNHIHHAGRVFHQAVGIFLGDTFGNVVAHNHIHDLFYSGISCGWVWGFSESISRDNRIEKNHIHHLGFGWLSDMGGIYTLGVQPGTTIRGNLIHDVKPATYGGWGIYLDEGSSHIVVENNITHDTMPEGFFLHVGRENFVRNNIFVAGAAAQVSLGKTTAGFRGFTFQNNIVVSEGSAIYANNYASDLLKPGFLSDYNLLWSTAGELWNKNGPNDKLDMEALREVGLDRHSIIADPRFADFAGRNFTLLPDSPAHPLGFQPIDMSDIGPRPQQERK
jgi:hypothetical protein